MTTKRSGLAMLLLVGGFLLAAPQAACAQKKERDMITREELEASAQRDGDLYSAIRSLRPHFLQPPRGNHGAITSMPTALFVNGAREPNMDALRRMSTSMVKEVRYLDPGKAEMEYGNTASGGAIVVKTNKPEESPPDER
ncbi:MAG: hypothetical protein ABJE47_19975 [bacterium]